MENLKRDLLKGAEHFAGQYYGKEDIKIEEGGQELYLTLGNTEKDGYSIQMIVWNDGQLNRIIISSGKVPFLNNQSVYVEDRTQEALDNFLYRNDGAFYEWLSGELERFEDRFEATVKRIRQTKGA
jgi:hypothetical protein